MKSVCNIILVVLIVSLVSCIKWGNRENSRLIEQALRLLEHTPDSALALLDAVNTVRFNDVERAEYTLLRIQARSNAGMDLSTDTEIFAVREYFMAKSFFEVLGYVLGGQKTESPYYVK